MHGKSVEISSLCLGASVVVNFPKRTQRHRDTVAKQRNPGRKTLAKARALTLPVVRAFFHVRIGPLHPTLGTVQFDESKLLVQPVGVFRSQNPTAKSL